MSRYVTLAAVLAVLQMSHLPTIKSGLEDLYPADRFFPTPLADGDSPPPSCCPATVEQTQAWVAANGADAGCNSGMTLRAGLDTGHWGYFYDGLKPAMVVSSGDEFVVEMPTPIAGQAYDLMVEGDAAMEEIYTWDSEGPAQMRGPYNNAFGHYMAGPIYVCGAEPGDVLQVDILDLQPRPNPGKENRTWGVTGNYFCGWQERAGYLDGGQHNAFVVYEVVGDPDTGKWLYWEPVYTYRLEDIPTHTTTCVPANGSVPRTTPQGAAEWDNPDYTFGQVHVPCTEGQQTWEWPYQYTGHVFDVPEEIRDYSVSGKYRLPVNMHIGNIGLSPKLGATVTTVPPTRTGGNIDNRRIGIGASIYFPVEVDGGLLSMGDCHGSMGDGETSCTGVEVSLEGRFRVTLHKAGSLPAIVEHLNYPLIENMNEYVLQAYTYADFLREIPNPQVNVFSDGANLNRAYTVAYNQTRDFLMSVYNLTEDESISVMGAGIDFGITQVVDGVFGIHSTIPKWMFDREAWDREPQYIPRVMSGTSRPPEEA